MDAAQQAIQEKPAKQRKPVIGDAEVKRAEELLQRYKAGKKALETRIIANEEWYKLQHWKEIKGTDTNPESTSAWMFNSIENKHADAMDNYPAALALAREKDDDQSAKIISSILPVILEECEYEAVYADAYYSKLKNGTGAKGIFWDKSKYNGMGDVAVREIDLLNLFWEPGIRDIQESSNLFHAELFDAEIVRQKYPQAKDITGGANDAIISRYTHLESIDTSEKVTVVDWYYKRYTAEGRTLLHYCKICNSVLLYASENDPQYADRGWYDHGLYPFVFDVLFKEKDMPVGFGYIDVIKSPQLFIDKLDSAILLHAWSIANQRYFLKGDGKVNETEFADLTKKFVHYYGSSNPNEDILPITVPQMTADVMTIRSQKIDEVKETSGNRDFSQGSTASGVTAASAIAALQEAGSKLSRDNIKASYRAHKKEAIIVVELMRQFYTEERTFRIIGETGAMEYVQYSGSRFSQRQQGDAFIKDVVRMPIYDIKIVAQKQSPFSTVAQNERAKELYQMAFFRPDNADQALAALSMMQFEGIDAVRAMISKNGTLYQKLMQLTPLILAMAQELDKLKKTAYTGQIAQILGLAQPPDVSGQAQKTKAGESESNALGAAFQESANSTAGAARKRAAGNSTPRV